MFTYKFTFTVTYMVLKESPEKDWTDLKYQILNMVKGKGKVHFICNHIRLDSL